MKGMLIVGIGTLGCKVVVRTKRLLKGQRCAWIRFVGIDTQTDEPALRDLEPHELLGIGEVPLEASHKTPEVFGPLVDGIFLEQLANHPPDLKKGGCLYPTATLLGVRFHQAAITGMLNAALGNLLNPENNITDIEVWVMGSNASTTGRGALLESCILLRQLLRGFPGINATLSCVVVGCQGLNPDKLDERQALEAGFWLEYNAAMEACPVPRPYDTTDSLWQGMVADYTFYVCANSSTWQLPSIEHVESWLAAWLSHTVLHPAVAEVLSGARVRHRPQIAGCDRGQRDPKRTFLSLAGFTVLSLHLPAVQLYGQARLAEMVLDTLLGDPPANTGNLIVSLGLHGGALEERLNFAGYSATLTQEIARLARALKEASLRQWPTLVQTSLVNTEIQIKNAQDRSPETRRDIRRDLEERLQQQLVAQTNGARHIVKALEDVQTHLALLHDQAIAQLRTLKRIDQTRAEVHETLKKVHFFNRAQQSEAIQAGIRRVEDAIRIVLNDAIVRLIDELSAVVAERLKTAREVVERLAAARAMAQAMAATALEPHACTSIRSLVASRDEFEALIAGVLSANTVQVLRDELVALGGREGDLLGLASFKDPARLVEVVCERIAARGHFATLGRQSFLEHFQRHYPTRQAQEDVLRWLYEKAEAPGGGVDVGYAQQTRAVPPGEQVRILVPTELVPLAQQLLAVVAPQLPAGALVGVADLGLVVATRELHHLPLYAQSYFRRIATRLPRAREALRRYVVAEWALDATSYLPYEPFEGWNGRELMLLGLTVGVVAQSPGGLAYSDPHIGVPVDLGALEDAARTIARNGHRPELVGLLEAALTGRAWSEVEARFGPTAERFPAHGPAIRTVYYKLRAEWDQLLKLGRPGRLAPSGVAVG